MEVQIRTKLAEVDEIPANEKNIKTKNPQNKTILGVLVHPAGLEPATC